jgi:hypothetical protein
MPGRSELLYPVVIKEFGEEPTMLLTIPNVPQIEVDRILEISLTRLKCEESHWFIKQSYN